MHSDILDELYRQYYGAALLYVLSLCGDRALAEEIVHDAFVKAYLSLPDDAPSFPFWLLWRQDCRPIHLSLRDSSIGWGESVNEDYPFLFLELPQHADAATLQQHLESQLQFIIDHEYLLNKLDNHSDPSALLDDLRRTGARFKGIWVTGTGEELLHLYESGLVGDIEPQEAHIALYG